MELLQETLGDVRVLALRGRLDLGAVPVFEKELMALVEGGAKKVLLDCSELKYVSSAGLGAFVGGAKAMGDAGAIAFAGLAGNIEHLFKMTGLASLFVMAKTREEALAKLG